MGKLIKTYSLAGGMLKCILEVCTAEVLGLKGNLRNIYIFSGGFCNTKARFVEMGINKSTKYFEVPESLPLKHCTGMVRSRKKPDVSCQTLEDEDKTFFIYILNRESV
jgi:hypothetical protein